MHYNRNGYIYTRYTVNIYVIPDIYLGFHILCFARYLFSIYLIDSLDSQP